LLLVFALEVISGVTGQFIYATVPSALTRLERHGLARLVEDLLDEEVNLERSVGELANTLPKQAWRAMQRHVESAAGSIHDRMSGSYDPPSFAAAARKKLVDGPLREASLSEDDRASLERVLESRCRLVDVRAQLMLHRRLRRWLFTHIATASALLIMLAFHIITALTFL